MSLKYVLVMGENRVSGFSGAYQFCHMPFDKIVLKGLVESFGFRQMQCGLTWTKQNDYVEYLGRQNWIRNKFSAAPLQVEFYLYQGKIQEVSDRVRQIQ